jgi:hypothetical protein
MEKSVICPILTVLKKTTLGSNTHRWPIRASHSRSWVLAKEAVADQMHRWRKKRDSLFITSLSSLFIDTLI